MVLIISYRIIYLLRNVTPVATRGINEEPNIYVGTPVLHHPDNTLALNPLTQPRATLSGIPLPSCTTGRKSPSVGLRDAPSHLRN